MQMLSYAVCVCMFLFIPSGWLSRGVIRLQLFDAKYKSKPDGCEPGPHRQWPSLPSAVQHTHEPRCGELSISISITQMNSIF